MAALLEIKNLHATVDGKAILNGLDLAIEAGKVHAVMDRSRGHLMSPRSSDVG